MPSFTFVAIPDAAEAKEAVRKKHYEVGSDIEDLGRVSDALIEALGLLPGQCVRADGAHDK